MGASEKQRSWTDRPVSGRAPASLPACIGALLALASETEHAAEPREVIHRMLDVLVQLEPLAAAGVVFEMGGETDILKRASIELTQGEPPAGPEGRLFPELAEERIVPLAGTVAGTLHLAAPSFENASSDSYTFLLHQAACAVSLALRALGGEAKMQVLEQHMSELEKLATLGQTAASIVHELNNPLTAIIAYADFLERRLTARQAPHTDLDRLRRISEAASRIQHFCRELTDYSRPASRLRAPVELHEVIDRALGFCMHGLRDADITVERVYRDIPMVIGIDSQLTQVFVNLFTNAWQAMGEGGGSLRISTRHEGCQVVVEVSDEGHGIPDEVLPRIFDSYFTTKPRGKGVGLGLSIVRQIVSDHGGAIRAARRAERGTMFVIELPTGVE